MSTERPDLFEAARRDLVTCFELRDDDFDAREGRFPAFTLLLMPSFGHELFLRASAEAGGAEVRLVTLQTNIGGALGFTLSDHLYASIRGGARPPNGCLHDVRERCESARWARFVEAMNALDATTLADLPVHGLDGCFGFATAITSPTQRGAFKAWSPREGSPQARFWDAMLDLARQTLLDERSQHTLDLVGGDAVCLIEGDTPILRVGMPLVDRSRVKLQSLLDGLGGRRALVDLSPLAGSGGLATRNVAAVRWPAEVLWLVPAALEAALTPMLDGARCVSSLEEAWARLRGT
jgi:hypothetical protein